MTVIQISSDVLHNVLTSKLSIALTGTIRPEYIETVAEDIAASIIELATTVEPAAVDWVQPKEIEK